MFSDKDGVVQTIYSLLAQKSVGLNDIMNNLELNVADTITYLSGIPQNWFFTNKRGVFQKKNRENVTLQKIYESFTKSVDESGIVAQFIYEINPRTNHEINEYESYHQSKVQIEYLNMENFRKFIYDNEKPLNGILQKFIVPYNEQNDLIECNWSQNLVLLNKKCNLNKIANKKMDPYEKASTFDGPEFHSQHVIVPLNSPHQIKLIHKMVGLILNKLSFISFGRFKLNRFMCYFKNSRSNKMYFLFCSAIRLDNKDSYYKMKGNENQAQKPMIYQNNFTNPEFVKRTFSLSHRHPKQLTCDAKCLSCEEFLISKDLSIVPYKIIIEYFDKFDKNVIRFNQKEQKQTIEEKFKSHQGQDERLKRQIKFVDGIVTVPKNKAEQLAFDSYMNFYQQKEKTQLNQVPPIFIKIYNDLNYEKYQQLKNTIDFRRKTLKICDKCYIHYLGEMKIAGKDRIMVHCNKNRINSLVDQYQDYKQMKTQHQIRTENLQKLTLTSKKKIDNQKKQLTQMMKDINNYNQKSSHDIQQVKNSEQSQVDYNVLQTDSQLVIQRINQTFEESLQSSVEQLVKEKLRGKDSQDGISHLITQQTLKKNKNSTQEQTKTSEIQIQSIKNNCFDNIEMKNTFDKEVIETLKDFISSERNDKLPKKRIQSSKNQNSYNDYFKVGKNLRLQSAKRLVEIRQEIYQEQKIKENKEKNQKKQIQQENLIETTPF